MSLLDIHKCIYILYIYTYIRCKSPANICRQTTTKNNRHNNNNNKTFPPHSNRGEIFLSDSFSKIKRKKIVVTVFLLIMNQTDLRSVHNQKENCHHDHFPFNLKRNWAKDFCECIWARLDVETFRRGRPSIEGSPQTPRCHSAVKYEGVQKRIQLGPMMGAPNWALW